MKKQKEKEAVEKLENAAKDYMEGKVAQRLGSAWTMSYTTRQNFSKEDWMMEYVNHVEAVNRTLAFHRNLYTIGFIVMAVIAAFK